MYSCVSRENYHNPCWSTNKLSRDKERIGKRENAVFGKCLITGVMFSGLIDYLLLLGVISLLSECPCALRVRRFELPARLRMSLLPSFRAFIYFLIFRTSTIDHMLSNDLSSMKRKGKKRKVLCMLSMCATLQILPMVLFLFYFCLSLSLFDSCKLIFYFLENFFP